MDGLTRRDYKRGYYNIISLLIEMDAVQPDFTTKDEISAKFSDLEQINPEKLVRILVEAEDAPIEYPLDRPTKVWLTDRETALEYHDALWEVYYEEVPTEPSERILPESDWDG